MLFLPSFWSRHPPLIAFMIRRTDDENWSLRDAIFLTPCALTHPGILSLHPLSYTTVHFILFSYKMLSFFCVGLLLVIILPSSFPHLPVLAFLSVLSMLYVLHQHYLVGSKEPGV
ncbi:uncharacterized protein BDW47DRAFT_108260 [Aspergillus candidus]|uniref:Uncharacterized protein n=1 Tax=Aspergillus candidus TaxID=41067 RepID=A0A2I2F7T4_ASPCN|nr:hypothetical protein BDW47DRAFT_108260 [Aspergillus candidus]PLB36685.1 hypothetical protein BDW47DRAFT_108260 [Aspergillus candidus]